MKVFVFDVCVTVGWRWLTARDWELLGSLASKKKCNLKPAARVSQRANQCNRRGQERRLTYKPERRIWYDWLKKTRKTRKLTVALFLFSPLLKQLRLSCPSDRRQSIHQHAVVALSHDPRDTCESEFNTEASSELFPVFLHFLAASKSFLHQTVFFVVVFSPHSEQRPETRGWSWSCNPLCQADLKCQRRHFFYAENLSRRPKAANWSRRLDLTAQFVLRRGVWLIRPGFSCGQRAAAFLPPQSSICAAPFQHRRYATLLLTALCGVPRTHTGGWQRRKAVPPITIKRFLSKHFTSFTPLRAHHSAPRLWESSSEPRLRNRQRRNSRRPVAPVNSPLATSAHESRHIVTGRGLKKRPSRAYTRPGRKEQRWPWEALCASIVGDDSHVRTLADMHEIQGHGHPGPAAVWCHTLEFLKLSHAHFYEMEPLAAYEDWRSFNMKVPQKK